MNNNIKKYYDLNTILFFSISWVLFAARTTKGVVRLSSSERALIKLPDNVKEILVGILLGDALIPSGARGVCIVKKQSWFF